MVSKKISQLDENGVIHRTDVFPVSSADGTSTYKVSMDDLVDYMDQNANFNPTIVEKIVNDYVMGIDIKTTVFLIDAQNNDITFTLNNYTEHVNQEFTFKRIDDNLYDEGNSSRYNVFNKGTDGNTIDGEVEIKINVKNESVSIVGSNAGWFII